MSDTVSIEIDRQTADWLDLAASALGNLQAIVDARYAGDLLDAVERARSELQDKHLEDARLAVQDVADVWNVKRIVPETQSLRVTT